MNSFNMFVPTRVVFGRGRLNELHKQKMPGKKALLVISNGNSAKVSGALDKTRDELQKAGAESIIFANIQPNPTRTNVMEAAALARKEGCDFVVALGGGSVMDAGKAIAFMATNPGDLWDYFLSGSGGKKPHEHSPLPLVCISTTAGTGSEADASGVITKEETNEKIGFSVGDSLFPVLSIIDPELMKGIPPKLTAFQGFDALFHATEGYISKRSNIMSEMYALNSIENVGSFLARAVHHGEDIEAREHMAFASMLSGIVMTLCIITAEHSIEHAMSAYHPDLPHGAGLIMISAAFYRFLIDRHVCDEKFVTMARALGMQEAKEPANFITALLKLQKDCGVDNLKMSDYGIKKEEFGQLARNARDTMGILFDNTPYDLSEEDVISILEMSYK